MRQLSPNINYSMVEPKTKYKIATGLGPATVTVSEVTRAMRHLANITQLQTEVKSYGHIDSMLRLAELMSPHDTSRNSLVQVKVLSGKVVAAHAKMERSKAMLRESIARGSATERARAVVLAKFEKLHNEGAASEPTAEQRRAKRREALMKMRALWQESNPDGMIDGVEYQKAMRAE